MSKLNWRSMIAVLSDLTEDELKQALDAELRTHKRPALARRLASAVLCNADGAGACRTFEGVEEMIDDKSDAGSWAEAMQFKSAVEPDHYKAGGIEAIDYIQAKLSPEEFAGYCRGNALKYVSRAGRKDAVGQEVRKAIWYLERWRDSLVRTDK
jgi:hypothetical protein